MVKINHIYTAYISWGNGGKRRPILVLKLSKNEYYFYRLTTKFIDKSDQIKREYFPINDWKQAGLKKQSYIDTSLILSLPINETRIKLVGKLSIRDRLNLATFISNKIKS